MIERRTAIDRFPKKPCKFCGETNHFAYACRENPKNKNRTIKRTRLAPIGKQGRAWLDTRAQWLKDNPPPIRGMYYECYLQIHPWCPKLVTVEDMQLDHVVSRTRDPSKRLDVTNLRPSCEFCNAKKGSKSLAEVKPGAV